MDPLLPITQLATEILEQYDMIFEDNAKLGLQDTERLELFVKAANSFLEGEKQKLFRKKFHQKLIEFMRKKRGEII